MNVGAVQVQVLVPHQLLWWPTASVITTRFVKVTASGVIPATSLFLQPASDVIRDRWWRSQQIRSLDGQPFPDAIKNEEESDENGGQKQISQNHFFLSGE